MVAAVLVLATVAAFALRRRDGQLKGTRQRPLTVAELGQPFGLAVDQAGAELAEHGVIEAGIGQVSSGIE